MKKDVKTIFNFSENSVAPIGVVWSSLEDDKVIDFDFKHWVVFNKKYKKILEDLLKGEALDILVLVFTNLKKV